MMMIKSTCYWINPRGAIYDAGTVHIDFVFKNAKLFGTDTEYLQSIYKKYNEKLGFEGKAREEIMIDILKKGWIRIRQRRNAWIIQCWNLHKFKSDDNIWEWTQQMVKNRYFGKLTEISISELSNNNFITTSAGDIIKGAMLEKLLRAKIKEIIKERLERHKNKKLN